MYYIINQEALQVVFRILQMYIDYGIHYTENHNLTLAYLQQKQELNAQDFEEA